ncbi:hypothetical protein D3C76_1057600 [compost metagenome]
MRAPGRLGAGHGRVYAVQPCPGAHPPGAGAGAQRAVAPGPRTGAATGCGTGQRTGSTGAGAYAATPGPQARWPATAAPARCTAGADRARAAPRARRAGRGGSGTPTPGRRGWPGALRGKYAVQQPVRSAVLGGDFRPGARCVLQPVPGRPPGPARQRLPATPQCAVRTLPRSARRWQPSPGDSRLLRRQARPAVAVRVLAHAQ